MRVNTTKNAKARQSLFTPVTNSIETADSQFFSTAFNERLERVQNDIGAFFAKEKNID
jgi:hypothetical protein